MVVYNIFAMIILAVLKLSAFVITLAIVITILEEVGEAVKKIFHRN